LPSQTMHATSGLYKSTYLLTYLTHPTLGREGKGRYGSFRQQINAGCAGETMRSLSTLEVCS